MKRSPLHAVSLLVAAAIATPLLAAGACGGDDEATTPATTGAGASDPGGELCGDGVCSHADDETCETCADDCGECPLCGNGACELESDLESCESCPDDCGACGVCGDGTCDAAGDETCETCADDCGVCDGCGDGACADAETCSSCEDDCGACDPCGDGTCDAASVETCSSCEEDCGACDACGDGTCDAQGGETCASCAKDCGGCDIKGCVKGDFDAYAGRLHEHTVLAGGKGTPGVAFKQVSTEVKPPFDFMWLSDHREGLTQEEWKSCRSAADKWNADGKFVAGCGFEKFVYVGADQVGHMNTLFVSSLTPFKKPSESQVPDMMKFLGECSPCAAQFNHPGGPTGMQGYKFYPGAKDALRLVEFNGKASQEKHRAAYFKALDNGWWVSPSWNGDDHNATWGKSPIATIVWTDALTRVAIRKGVRANRTAATNDRTSRFKMTTTDGCWMGSHLQGKPQVDVVVELSDKEAGDVFTSVRFYGPGGADLGTKACSGKNPCKVQTSVDVTKPTYVVAVATQKDDDLLISAPIWLAP